MEKKRPYYGDAQAFLGFPGQPPRIEKGTLLDLALVTCAPPAGPCAQSLKETIAACETFKTQLTATDAARIVTRADQVDVDDGRVNLVLGLQNLPADTGSKNMDWFRLREAGVRVIGPVFDGINPFGSGCLNLDMGMTDAGEDALCRIQDYEMILDLSHAGHRTAREALEVMDRRNIDIPVMASHGGCYAVYSHFRNLPDDVLVGIAKRGGVVGIASLTFILNKQLNGVNAFFPHLEHVVQVCGSGSVVIGSDAPYVLYTEEQERKVFEQMKGLIDPDGTWGARCPMYVPDFKGPRKIQKIIDTSYGVFDEGIFGKNLLSFFQRALPK